MPELNPVEQVYSALYDAAIAHPVITSLFKALNTRGFTTSTTAAQVPLKTIVQTADLPELILSFDGFRRVVIGSSSSGTELVPQFSFLVRTQGFNLSSALFPAVWALLEVLAKVERTLLSSTWEGTAFCKKLTVIDSVVGLRGQNTGDAPAFNNQVGWSALLRFETLIHVRTSVLISNATA